MLQTYIDKFKLQVQWIDEGGFWGSQDENGTFNGVVGRVSKKFRSLYAGQRRIY